MTAGTVTPDAVRVGGDDAGESDETPTGGTTMGDATAGRWGIEPGTGTRLLAVSLAALVALSALALAPAPAAAGLGDGETTSGEALSVEVRCTADGTDLLVESLADREVELRDIDSAGQDVIDGRPRLAPGGTTTLSGVGDGPVVLAAFDPDTGKRVGDRVRFVVDCADGDGPLSVDVRCTADGADLVVTNEGGDPVELRDIDAEGRDVLDGRSRLAPGASTTLADVGDGPVVLAAFDPDSGDRIGDRVRVTVDCGEPFFDVSDVGTGSSTTAGDEFDVSATVTNTGDGAGTRTVELRFDDEVVATEEVTLDPGESVDLEFVLPGDVTIEFEPERSYTVTVDSGDDADSTEKFVLSP